MKRQYPVLQRIDNNEELACHEEFLYHLQSAMLLALRERGMLNAMQHRHAEETLKQQRRERAKNISERGERR